MEYYLKSSEGTLIPISKDNIRESSVWEKFFSPDWFTGQPILMDLSQNDIDYLIEILNSENLSNMISNNKLSTIFRLREIADEYIITRLTKIIENELPNIIEKRLPKVYNTIKGIPNEEYDKLVYYFAKRLFIEGIAPTVGDHQNFFGDINGINEATQDRIKRMVDELVDDKFNNMKFNYKEYLEYLNLDRNRIQKISNKNEMYNLLKENPYISHNTFSNILSAGIDNISREDIDYIKDVLRSKSYIITVLEESVIYEYFDYGDDISKNVIEELMYLLNYRYNQLHSLSPPIKGKKYFTDEDYALQSKLIIKVNITI